MATDLDGCLALLGDHLTTDNHHDDAANFHRELLELLLEQDFDNPQEEQWFYVYNILMTVLVIVCVAVGVGGAVVGHITLTNCTGRKSVL